MAHSRGFNTKPNRGELHRQWLDLVDTDGPFLAVPPLKRVWPNGIPDFRTSHPDRFDVLLDARKDFESAWEQLDRRTDSDTALDSYRVARDKWVETVLRDVAGWAESLQWGAVPGVRARSANRAVTVTAQAALVGPDSIGVLVHVVDPTDSLRQTPGDLWAATPVDRCEALLRVRLSSAEIRVAEVLLSAGQLLFDRTGSVTDPYMTLVGYFNATRELAGMARYIADDVANRVRNPRKDSGFPRRYGMAYGNLHTAELTSRIASAEIARTLDRLGLEFDPGFDTTDAVHARIAASRAEKKVASRKEAPFDVVLATSMLQVGVDVQRLGIMLVVGQPKNTAEYIQASSRVGRDASDRPGLVVSLGNWARPRDLAHFEQFRHYHGTFHAQVEALSVTPYSPTSLARGIDGLLVSVTRVLEAPLSSDGLSPERNAWRIKDQRSAIDALVDRLKSRIAVAAQDDAATKRAGDLLVNRIDRWAERAKRARQMSKTLVYERVGEGDRYLPLIISPENAKASAGGLLEAPFVIANSMREVQPEINLLVSPLPERLFARAPEGAPEWRLPTGEDD